MREEMREVKNVFFKNLQDFKDCIQIKNEKGKTS